MPSHAPRRLLAGVVATATTTAVCALALTPVTAATAAIVPDPITYSAEGATLSLAPLGSFATGAFDESAAEIVAAYGDRLFVVDAQAGAVSVLDYSDPESISEEFALTSAGVANSVAVRADGLGVVAFEAESKTDPGQLVFFDANAADAASALLGSVEVGALPDMVTFSKDGAYAVVANEGEPADDFSSDPEGSVGIVALPSTLAAPAQDAVKIADFHAFEAGGSKTLPADVRVFGPTPHGDDHPVSRNLEPEYVAVDGALAYVALQEANAVAVVDLASATVTDIWSLGFKDHSLAQNALDPSDEDGGFSLRTFAGLKGIYMPDGIQSYSANGQTYLVTANEGDAREWGDYVEPSPVKSLAKDGYGPVCADSPLAALTGDADLGRLNVTTENGFDADAGCYSELYASGGRSFSIWTTDGQQVFDSGSSFEQVTAAAVPGFVNSTHTGSKAEGRSDDKGPEPENLAIGTLSGRTYAFVGFERIGGIAVYDITDPAASAFVTYVNNRDFSVSVKDGGDLAAAGDLGPEGIAFIPAESSATGEPLLAVGNEVSGTTTLYAIDDLLAPVELTLLGINDFHGRIDANTVNFAGTIEQLRAAATGPSLFLSAGDNIGASLFASSVAEDQPTIDVLNALGLQTSAVGNHEFDRGFADLSGRVEDAADFSHLAANVYSKGTTTPALDEYATFDAEGLTVAVVGAVTEETPALVSPAGVADLEFGDPVEAVNRVAAQLSDGNDANGEADVIVAMYHEGAGAGTPDGATLEQEVAAGGVFAAIVEDTAPTVDAIFTGHTHKEYAWSAAVPGTDRTRPIVQTGSYGARIGKITLTLDRATGDLLAHTEENVARTTTPAAELVGAFPRVAEVDAIVKDALADAAEIGNTRVAEVSGDITTAFAGGSFVDGVWTGGSRDDRASESALGNLVAESIRSSLSNLPGGAQIGVTNPGGLRAELWDTQAEFGASAIDGLEDGEISFSQANAVLPFNNTMALITLTGEQFTTLLEQQWQRDAAGKVPSRPYLQLGLSENVTYTYDAGRAEGDRITSVTVDGEPLDPSASYRIGTLSFLATGGDNFRAFTEGTDYVDTGLLDYEAWIDYLADASPAEASYAKHAVAVAGAPDVVRPGAEVSLVVSNLDMTSRGTPESTEVEARIGDTVLGAFPVSSGTAHVTVTIPGGAKAGSTVQLQLATDVAGTLVTVPLEVGDDSTPEPETDWATVDIGSGAVEQGGSLSVRLSGLEPGQQVAATLFSNPIVVPGIPAADASGKVAFTVRIPADLALGAHTLVIESAGFEPIAVGVTVVAPGQLAVTGAQLPWAIALGAALLVVLGSALVALRRRPAMRA